MTFGIDNEILAYALTVALAVSAGLVLGGPSSRTHRWMAFTAGLLIVGVVVVGGFALEATAPWIGPIFALVCVSVGTLAAAAAKGNDPGFVNESFGSRVIAVLNVRRGVPLDDATERAPDPHV